MSTRNNNRSRNRQKWIGLAHVKPQPGNDTLGNALGAFVPAVALAGSARDYAQQVTAALNSEGFDVPEIEDIETLAKRARKHSLPPDFLILVEGVTEENPLAFDTFQSYLSEDSEEPT